MTKVLMHPAPTDYLEHFSAVSGDKLSAAHVSTNKHAVIGKQLCGHYHRPAERS